MFFYPARYIDFEDKSFWLENIGLPSDATKTQIIEAKIELWGQGKVGYMHNIREKLGLSDDASDEEVQEVLNKWKEEKNFHKGSGLHKGSWCDKS